MSQPDLHCHSTVSDGLLSPGELIVIAARENLPMLAITDHDSIDAHRQPLPVPDGLALVAGVEFSTTWRKIGIHVVGLNFDPASDAMEEGVRRQARAREERSHRIAERLEKLGFENSLEGAKAFAGSTAVGRPHFARYLVEAGYVRDVNEAFKRYLGNGKPGDIRQFWASMGEVIQWIRDSGGTPVLAHPDKYQLTRTRLRDLLADFYRLGGQGMEVVSGRQPADRVRHFAELCAAFNLLASTGSDFHEPGQSWTRLGGQSPLPPHCRPVWDAW